MDHYEDFSESRKSHFIIEVMGVEMMFPSLHLSVEANDAGFSGLNREVWVETDNLMKFVEDLQHCEQMRSGTARLVSISPDELDLTIEKSDGWGHFVLRYKIGKTSCSQYSRSELLDKTVAGGFDLDSSLLGEIVSLFADLLPAREGQDLIYAKADAGDNQSGQNL